MKKSKRLLFFFFCFSLSLGTLSAQDLHFTLFNYSPLTLNPAQTGAFYGTARIGGIYRDQWRSVLGSNAFQTPVFYIDAPIIRGFGKNDWVGVGASFINDQAGTAGLSVNGTQFSASYHLSLSKKGTSVLTIGAQGGRMQRKIDQEELLFEDSYQLQGGAWTTRPTEETLNPEKAFFTINAGLMLRSKLNDQSTLELGLASGHLTQPNYNFISTAGDQASRRRPMRITAHGSLQYDLNDQFRITPMAMFQTTQGATEAMVQVWGGLLINPQKAIRLNFGTGYRLGDAVPLLFGMDIEDLRVALSYDINVSSLTTVSNSVGSFELAASYIIKIFKKPNVSPAILCPEF